MDQEGGGDSSNSWCTSNSLRGLGKEIGGIGNQRKNRDHINHSTPEIESNTEKSPKELRR